MKCSRLETLQNREDLISWIGQGKYIRYQQINENGNCKRLIDMEKLGLNV